jgi:hypothetical protein
MSGGYRSGLALEAGAVYHLNDPDHEWTLQP